MPRPHVTALLALFFFLVITPIGLIYRVLGMDPLRLKYDGKTKSYWQDKNPEADKASSFKSQM